MKDSSDEPRRMSGARQTRTPEAEPKQADSRDNRPQDGLRRLGVELAAPTPSGQFSSRNHLFSSSSGLATGRASPVAPIEAAPASRRQYRCSGRVRNERYPAGVGPLRIEIADRNIGADFLLAETETDLKGYFTASFQIPDDLTDQYRPDLQVRVFSGAEELGRSDVVYDAGEVTTIDVTLRADVTGLPSEYELLDKVIGAHGDGALSTLRETSETPDITYLARKAEVEPEKVALVAAAHLSARSEATGGESPVPAELYYALFRAGIPAEPSVLYQIAPQAVLDVWNRAIDDGVIPDTARNELPSALERFIKLATKAVQGSRAFPGGSTVRDLARGALGDDQQRHEQFADLLVRYRSEPETLWSEVRSSLGPEPAARLQLDGKLAHLTLDNAPLMTRLHGAEANLSAVSELAERGFYRSDRWLELIQDDVPQMLQGDDLGQRRIWYAETLATQIRLAFPTTVIATMLGRGELPLAVKDDLKGRVHAFLTEHQERFDIGAQPVTRYLAAHVPALEPYQDVIGEIERIQRLYQITPTDEALAALMEAGINSALELVGYGEDQVARTFGSRLGDRTARLMHAKARQVHHATLSLAATYLTARRAPAIGSDRSAPMVGVAERPTLAGQSASAMLAYPTLEELFGSIDYCECDHCRSVLSPAAYLVDLLMFLDRPVDGKSPQALLFQRRPDLQNLPLTCENTNTILPYIDIVNETLEHFVAHGLSLEGYLGHDTGDVATTEELLASPQFVEEAAYVALQAATFPPPLPFHRPLETVRRYLHQLGLRLADAMQTLQANDKVELATAQDYGWRDILLERLEISREQRLLLVGVSVSLAALYGFPEGTSSDDVRAEFRDVRQLTRRTGLSFAELNALLGTRYINPGEALRPALNSLNVSFANIKALHDGTISPEQFRTMLPAGLDETAYGGDVVKWLLDELRYQRIMHLIVVVAPSGQDDPCSLEGMELRVSDPASGGDSISESDYLRIMRFIRLWRHLGWSIDHTDAVIQALMPDGIDDPGLSRLGAVKTMLGRLGLTADQNLNSALACWAPIGTAGPDSLYNRLFMRPSSSPRDAAFDASADGQVLTDGTAKLVDGAATLQAALKLTADDLAYLLEVLKYDTKTALTLDTVTELFRRAWLARTLHLSVHQLTQILRWTGIDPFDPPDTPARPMTTLLDFLDSLQAASLTPAQALYLIWNQSLSAPIGTLTAGFDVLVRTVRENAAAIEKDFSITDDPNGTIARKQMAMVFGTEATDFFFGLLDETQHPVTVPYTHPDQKLPSTIMAAAHGRLGYDPVARQLSYQGELSRTTVNTLKAIPGGSQELQQALERLYTASQVRFEPFFARHESLRALLDAYTQSDLPLQERRRALLAGVIPDLKARRTTQQALTSTTAVMGLSDALASALLTDNAVLHSDGDATRPALDDMISIQKPGLAAQFFWSSAPAADADPDLSQEAAPVDYSIDGTFHLPANPTAGESISGVWSGEIDVMDAGDYEFAVEAEANANVSLTLDGTTIGHDVAKQNGWWICPSPVALAAGRHIVTLRVNGITTTMRLNWRAASGPAWELVPVEILYSEILLARALSTYVRVVKAATLADALRLSPLELSYFASAQDYRIAGHSWLNALRATGDPDQETSRSLYRTLSDLLAFVRIRNDSAPETDLLISLLQDPAATLPTGKLALPLRIGWPQETVETLLTRFGCQLGDLGRMGVFKRVYEAQALAKKAGIATQPLIATVTNNPTPEMITGLESAMRARYDHAGVLDALTRVNDELRTTRRDALVAYILHSLAANPETRHVDTPDKLFELLLMDIAMDPCQQTTRIRHALSSVQIFVDRCLMGLEVGEEFPRLYRLYNGKDHFYTLSSDEQECAIRSGYTSEGVEGYPFAAPEDGAVPLFRLRQSTNGDHFYTATAAERDTAIAVHGYVSEGTACYVFSTQMAGTVPLFRMWKPDPPDHFYTTSAAGRVAALGQGYQDEGVSGYVRTAGQTSVSPRSIDSGQWEWMKRYRVWEANRRVFLWPENWLDPELRNDQSQFFTEVMSELMQGDITDDRAASAMINYLSRLEEVAQLEPCGMEFVPGPHGTADDVVHVVARTGGSRRVYFYRRREGVTWTPWEPIKLDIEDNPVCPVVWNGRLFLFWLRVIQRSPTDPNRLFTGSNAGGSKGLADVSISDVKQDAKINALNTSARVEGVLCWSEYYHGQWQSPKASDANSPTLLGEYSPGTFDRSKLGLWSYLTDTGALYIRILGSYYGGFLFFNSHSDPVRQEDHPPFSITRPSKSRAVAVEISGKPELAAYYSDGSGSSFWLNILRGSIPFRPAAQTGMLASGDTTDWPFFLADSRRSFFVTSQQAAVGLRNFTGFGVVMSSGTAQAGIDGRLPAETERTLKALTPSASALPPGEERRRQPNPNGAAMSGDAQGRQVT